MFIDNDDFGLPSDLFEDNDNLFKQNINTILGKNVVLNFVARVNFEILNLGWSQTANKIAKFYDSCNSYITFMSNPVVKMILEEIEYIPATKKYLNQRIFQYIEKDKIKDLDRLYKNSERITEDIKSEEDRRQQLKDRINNRIKQQGVDFTRAINNFL